MSRHLVPWRRSPLVDLHQELDSLFGDLWEGPGPIGATERAAFRDFQPRLDVSENDDAFVVSVELPGLEQKDVDVSLTDDVLVLQGEKRVEAKDEDEAQHRTERLYGRFQRAIRLPRPVDPDKVQATFRSGVLTIRLPKSAEARQRKVPIQVEDR